jgi:TolB protein
VRRTQDRKAGGVTKRPGWVMLGALLMLAIAAGHPLSSEATFPGQNGRIYFGKFTEIWSMNPDGTDPARVPAGKLVLGWPNVSPDGNRLVYVAMRGPDYPIKVMSLTDPSQKQRLTGPGSFAEPAFSGPTGDRIAYVPGGPDGNIWIMDADGSHKEQLTSDPAQDEAPTFSPDGEHIAFTRSLPDASHPEIYEMDADGSNLHPLTNTPGGGSLWPSYSPDGGQIAFSRWLQADQDPADDDNFRSAIYTMNSDGSGVHRVTPRFGCADEPVFSPRGQNLAFTNCQDGYAVAKVRLDGSHLRSLTDPREGGVGNPDWAPRP